MSYNYDEGNTADVIKAASDWMSKNLMPVVNTGTSGYAFDVDGYTGQPVEVKPTTPSSYSLPNEGGPRYSSSSGSNLVAKMPVKIPSPEYVDFNESEKAPITANEILNLYFEQINGHALLLLSNVNFVNAQNISYQPILNMFDFKQTYDPKKLLGLQDTSDTFFSNFSIKLDNKIPNQPSSSSTNGTNVYIATNQEGLATQEFTGYNRFARIVIETINMENDERVEIEILSGGTIETDLIEEYGS